MNPTRTVLLVEKDEADFRFMNAALRRGDENWRVHWAHDGADACAYLAGVDGYADRAIFPLPDVVLVDVRKPGVSELEFVSWLRRDGRFLHLPVIALAASHESSDEARARALGVNAFHLRPADPQRFASLVGSLVRFWGDEAANAAAISRPHAA